MNDTNREAEIRERAEAAAPGPWRWEVNRYAKQVNLQGGRRPYDISIIRFVRWATSGAAPTFLTLGQSDQTQMSERADFYAVPVGGRAHHADWFAAIGHPDAQFIENAREDIPYLLDALERAREREREMGRRATAMVLAVERVTVDQMGEGHVYLPWAAWRVIERAAADLKKHALLTSEDSQEAGR